MTKVPQRYRQTDNISIAIPHYALSASYGKKLHHPVVHNNYYQLVIKTCVSASEICLHRYNQFSTLAVITSS